MSVTLNSYQICYSRVGEWYIKSNWLSSLLSFFATLEYKSHTSFIMRSSLAVAAFAATLTLVQAGLEKNESGIAVYWGKVLLYERYSYHFTNWFSGQNSINQANPPNAQKRLGYYCQGKCSLSYYLSYVTARSPKLTVDRRRWWCRCMMLPQLQLICWAQC